MTDDLTTTIPRAIDGQRRLPSSSEFAKLVVEACLALIQEGKPFTAKSVTNYLQLTHKDLEIRHYPYAHLVGVQESVHDHAMPYLLSLPTTPPIQMSWELWSADSARTYTPVNIQVLDDDDDTHVSLGAPPQLPASFDVQRYNVTLTPLADSKGIGLLGIPMLTDDDDDTDD